MRITLIESGKTRDPFIQEGVELFKKEWNVMSLFRLKQSRT